MANHYPNLNQNKALIWRITHRQNLPWILANGLHAGSSPARSPAWVTIGNEDLISRRAQRRVPIAPGGTLHDYVPFYFTPFSPMMYNIHTGRGGVRHVPNEDIIILVSSMPRLLRLTLPFVFTDRHAYPVTAQYYNNLAALQHVDWPILQQRNFQRDPNDPEKVERYQAEALVHQHLPIDALHGVVCYTPLIKQELEQLAHDHGVQLDVRCLPHWYF